VSVICCSATGGAGDGGGTDGTGGKSGNGVRERADHLFLALAFSRFRI